MTATIKDITFEVEYDSLPCYDYKDPCTEFFNPKIISVLDLGKDPSDFIMTFTDYEEDLINEEVVLRLAKENLGLIESLILEQIGEVV